MTPQQTDRVAIYCPFCHQHTSLEPAKVQAERGIVPAVWQRNAAEAWWIGVCNYCNKPVLLRNQGDIVYPSPRPEPTSEDVPEEIRRDLDEAKQCFAVKALRATATMARRAMQAAAIDKGAQTARLRDQIDELAAQGKITSALKEMAHVVRWVGNDGAHPGGEPVTEADADEVLRLAEQFLYVIYVSPAQVQKLRDRRGI